MVAEVINVGDIWVRITFIPGCSYSKVILVDVGAAIEGLVVWNSEVGCFNVFEVDQLDCAAGLATIIRSRPCSLDIALLVLVVILAHNDVAVSNIWGTTMAPTFSSCVTSNRGISTAVARGVKVVWWVDSGWSIANLGNNLSDDAGQTTIVRDDVMRSRGRKSFKVVIVAIVSDVDCNDSSVIGSFVPAFVGFNDGCLSGIGVVVAAIRLVLRDDDDNLQFRLAAWMGKIEVTVGSLDSRLGVGMSIVVLS